MLDVELLRASMLQQPHPCERVLVVDDNVDLLSTLSDLLTLEGVREVRTASTLVLAEAILADGFQPSAVLLDLHLEGASGEPFIQRLRGDPAYSSVPIVALSGDHLSLRRVEKRVTRVLLKPTSPGVLVDVLREVCASN